MSIISKAELRTQVQAKLAERNLAKKQDSDQSLYRQFLALPQLKTARRVLLFLGVGTEPDTRPLIQHLLQQGYQVALPRCLPGRQMEARLVTDLEHLVDSPYHIPEPSQVCPVAERDSIDMILVPNLCCDRRGYRLGHGGGYYDRYLAGYQGFTVAFCPELVLQEQVPVEAYDVAVGLVLVG